MTSKKESKKPGRSRTHPPEFKAEAVRRCREGKRSIEEVAKEVGVTTRTLERWVGHAIVDEQQEEHKKASRIEAYEVGDTREMPLTTATVARRWMDRTGDRFAYRCLPMLIANQAGWIIPCPITFTATWSGGDRLDDIALDFGGEPPDPRVASHFGSGIVTFTLPYLFRTTPGLALWARGPANYPKDGACALEGIVETDWSPATFTMNWKLTRPKLAVTFTKGEPVCMVTAASLDLLETLLPVRLPRSADPELAARYEAWSKSRREFNDGLKRGESDALQRRWQKDYFVGAESTEAHEHRTKLELSEFAEATKGES